MAPMEPAANPDESQFENPGTEDEPMLYCPVCSTRLASLKCKLFCERCGYFMSCADYH